MSATPSPNKERVRSSGYIPTSISERNFEEKGASLTLQSDVMRKFNTLDLVDDEGSDQREENN